MLGELLERYPLPPGWAAPERFTETLALGASFIDLSGLSVVAPDGEQITGSAASVGSSASSTARSYFELLERVSVVMAMSNRRPDYKLLDRLGRPAGHVSRSKVFAETPEPDRWRPSRSNGVALHDTWQEACDRAATELVERDRVLRSWYGESVPRKCTMLETLIPSGLQSLANWSAYELTPGAEAIGRTIAVAAVVGFPRAETTPVVYGFAANAEKDQAFNAAAAEAVQRFGFLLGEAIPRARPSFSPTPDFHQEFFLFPPSHALLRDWLGGSYDVADIPPEQAAEGHGWRGHDAILFVDLTPPQLSGSLFVAKAVCPLAEPLVFGEPAPHRADCNSTRRVHPIA